MTVTLKIRVCDLGFEFFTHTLESLCPFQTAGTIAAGSLQTVFHELDHFLVFIQPNRHSCHILLHSIMKNPHPAGYGSLAERVGFEPTVGFPITSFQDWLLKPLGQPSIFGCYDTIIAVKSQA